MAISVSGNPYSINGASVSGLVSTDYMTGKSKMNYGMLMRNTALPDFSVMKLDSPSSVFSLAVTQDSVTLDNTSIAHSNTKNETIETIQPLKLYTANTTGISVIEPKFTLHGVEFTANQIQTSTEFLEGISNTMRELGATSGTLDYDDYAVMGLGESQIKKFGAYQGFSDEQINAVITDYRNTLKELVKQSLSDFPLDKQAIHLPQSKYFLTYYSKNKVTGTQTLITCPEMAINYEMIQSIYDTFSNVDADNESSMNHAVSQFKEQTIVARKAGLPISNNEWVKWRISVYEDNINKFHSAANELQSVTKQNYPHLDIKI